MKKQARLVRNWLWSAVGVLGGLWLTGVVWLILEYAVRVESDFGATRWAGQSKILQTHGWLSAFSIFLLGALVGLHVLPQWHSGQRRRSGLWLLGVVGFLALSGTALYYIAHESARNLASFAHWGLGLALPTFIAIHLVRSKVPGPVSPKR